MKFLIRPARPGQRATHIDGVAPVIVRELPDTAQVHGPADVRPTLAGLVEVAGIAPVRPLPATLPAWRIHAVAALHGLTATINTILASLPEPQKTVAKFAWTQGNEVARTSATYRAIIAALALDAEAEAGLWAEAAGLEV